MDKRFVLNLNYMGIYLQSGLFVLVKDKETVLGEIESVANSP